MTPNARKLLEVTREELLSELGLLDARERGLQAQHRDTIYRLEQIHRERERLERHLSALDSVGEEKAA